MPEHSHPRKAVVAVFHFEEQAPFIREWCLHHRSQGWSVVLYDSAGLQSETPEGLHGAHAADLRDLDATIVRWHRCDGRDTAEESTVGAYVHFIRNFGDQFEWAAFLDTDEYLHAAKGLAWDHLLTEVSERGCYRLVLEGVVYENRKIRDGTPLPAESLGCSGRRVAVEKSIVKPAKAILADVHWGWMMQGSNDHATVDPFQFHFRRYRGIACDLRISIHQSSLPDNPGKRLPVHLPGEGEFPAAQWQEFGRGKTAPFWRISGELETFIAQTLPRLHSDVRGILELGPGYSTMVLSRTFPDARIVSVEHEAMWADKSKTFLQGRKNIEIRLCPLDPDDRWYTLEPGPSGSFDILLIDGPPGRIAPGVRDKATSLAPLLERNSIVILNNTDRQEERASIRKWALAGGEIIAQGASFTALLLAKKKPTKTSSVAQPIPRVPVVCINLARARERKSLVEQTWRPVFGSNLTFFPAVDRRDLENGDLTAALSFSPGHPLIGGRRLTVGEVACVLSHIKVFDGYTDQEDGIIVMEDDVVPLPHAAQTFGLLAKARKELPQVDILLLFKPSSPYSSCLETEAVKLADGRRISYGAYLVWFGPNAIRDYTARMSMLDVPADYWTEFCAQGRVGLLKDPVGVHRGDTTYIGNKFRPKHRSYLP